MSVFILLIQCIFFYHRASSFTATTRGQPSGTRGPPTCFKRFFLSFTHQTVRFDEVGEDAGGLTKDLFSTFWEAAFKEYFLGDSIYVPFLPIHRLADSEVYQTLDRILTHAAALTGTIHKRLSRSSIRDNADRWPSPAPYMLRKTSHQGSTTGFPCATKEARRPPDGCLWGLTLPFSPQLRR